MKRYNEYEWVVKNIFSNNDQRQYMINILTNYNINNVYISIQEYLSLIQDIINDNFILEKNHIAEKTNFDKFNKFLQNYRNNSNEYNVNIIKSCYKFLKSKFGMEVPVKYDGFYCIEGRNLKILEQQENYININNSLKNKVMIIEVIFLQKSFFSRFIFNTEQLINFDDL